MVLQLQTVSKQEIVKTIIYFFMVKVRSIKFLIKTEWLKLYKIIKNSPKSHEYEELKNNNFSNE